MDMHLGKTQLVSPHIRNAVVNHRDVLQLASLIEYNINYAIAFLISQDNSLVKAIIATHNQIEDKSSVLLEILQEETVLQEDSLYMLCHNVLLNMQRINSDTIDIIKVTSQLYQTYPEATELLQDTSKLLSLMFKSTIDAYIQRDIEIARKSSEFKNALDDLLIQIAHIMGATVSRQLQKISATIINIQNAIIEVCENGERE